MPLLDHFHGVIEADSPWESFHTQWASSIAACLNQHVSRGPDLRLTRRFTSARALKPTSPRWKTSSRCLTQRTGPQAASRS